ncbi:type VI secretion system ATPase TssH [Alkalimarinus coralli]|uniref:type VI secretion system ATPase TssH n=1 Tax=Alkalimarinus coralli TaxID=2935863 RepID=UPI00202BA188|nr:type VI secretion system ATPase TssH [Alkalimarinus coralli]
MELEKLIDKLHSETRLAVEQAALACIERKGIEITLEDLLLTLIDGQTEFSKVLLQFDIDIASFRSAVQFEQDTRSMMCAKPVFSELLINTLQEAWLIASLELSLPSLSSGTIIMVLLKNQLRYGHRRYIDVLSDGVSYDHLVVLIQGLHSAEAATNAGLTNRSNIEAGKSTEHEEILQKVTTSLTELAQNQQLDPVVGRDEEIRQTIDILCRRRKNNPILLGEAGVGKTAIVEGLAQKIAEGNVPVDLVDVDLRLLDLAALQAGASVKGEFERRVSLLIDAIQVSNKPVILFIDEAHLMVGAGSNEGGGDVANLLKPALARGELRTVAATTLVEYKRYIEKDPALVRRFQSVKVGEPTIDQTVTLLRGLRDRYEQQHGVYIRDDALVAAASMSSRYLMGRQLPDKAIDLIDTACARVKAGLVGKPTSVEFLELQVETVQREIDALTRDLVNDGYSIKEARPATDNPNELDELYQRIDQLTLQLAAVEATWHQERALVREVVTHRDNLDDEYDGSKKLQRLRNEISEMQGESPLVHYEVTALQIGEILSSWTGIPAGKMLMGEAQKLGALSTQLEMRVKGQSNATQQISERLCQARAGLNDPEKPLAVFLLVGPSGVGKTETALTIADTLFGGEKYLTTINMSEFQEKHTVSRLIGSPPGYVGYGEGGVLTEAVRQKPFSVVLLDEVEKADPDVLNIFYQVFDKGTMNDGEGRLIDFRNTVIVLTSNLASDQIETLCASSLDENESDEDAIDDAVLLEKIRPTLNHYFKPALLARMEVLTYRPLEKSTLRLLVGSKLEKLSLRLSAQGICLHVADSVLSALSSRCVLVEAGARHIDKLINQHIAAKLSKIILLSVEQQESLADVYVSYQENEFVVSRLPVNESSEANADLLGQL